MKRFSRIIMISSLFALACFALVLSTSPASTVVTAQSSTCESRCDAARESCRTAAKAVYNDCKAHGGSDAYCGDRRSTAYVSCMQGSGCNQCFDGRTGLLWYCACGRPYDMNSGGVKGGGTISPYDYSDIPYGYTWEGWGCDSEPAYCDPGLWY